MRTNSRYCVIAALFVAVVVGSLLLSNAIRKTELYRSQKQFEVHATDLVNSIEQNVDVYIENIIAIQRLFATGQPVDRESFKAFVAKPRERLPGIRGLGWNPRVTPAERAAYVERARADGITGFQFKQWRWNEDLQKDEWIPSEEEWAKEYVVAYYLEPRDEQNLAVLGIDIASNPVRRKALERSLDRDRPIATDPIDLAQTSGQDNGPEDLGYLIALPIYETGMTLATDDDRTSHLRGFAIGVFLVRDIVESVLKEKEHTGRGQLHLAITDNTHGRSKLLFKTGGDLATGGAAFTKTFPREVAGRSWHLSISANSNYLEAHTGYAPHMITTAGLLFAVLLAVYLITIVRKAQEIERLVQERTTELTSEVAAHQETSRNLRAAKEAAEAGNQAKSNFLATISHDIRTPLHVILGMTGLAHESSRNPQQKEYLKVLKESADSLLEIINKVLDMSRIEAGNVLLRREPFNLRDELAAALESLGLLARDKKIKLSWNIAPKTPLALLGDRDRLRQVIINLVSNAIKFTARGEVGVEVCCDQLAGDRATLHFLVRDTGIGISKEELKKVFAEFEQGDSSTSSASGGAGLGLSIATQLAKLMNGKIWAQSKEGKGSTFHLLAEFEVLGQQGEEAAPLPTQDPEAQ